MQLTPQVRRLREGRYRWLAGLIFAGFAIVSLGLVRLQVGAHEEFRQLSKENHVRLEVLRAPRGAIYDRNGELLADSAPSFSVVFRPFPAESLHRARQLLDAAWLANVARLLETDSAAVRRAVSDANSRGQSTVLRRNAPFSVRAAIEESRDELPGIDVMIEPLRRYPHGIAAAHLLGYAGEVNDTELDSLAEHGYRPGDLIGRSGIERTYEDVLRGVDGAEFVVVNAAGRRVSSLGEDPPQPPAAGHDLVLTVDLKVQQALEQAMSGVARGAAVALDPRDGGVLGLVSRPAFDPNEFSVGISHARWRELTDGGANPLLNRAIQGMYPPGSTFKIVTMLAALRNGVARPGSHMQGCTGRYVYGGRGFRCWKHEGHGVLDFIGALQHSCDVYFYQIGTRLGLPRLEETARGLGFGDRTGVDLPQEKKGLIPGPSWYDRQWGAGRWHKGLLLNLAIGQGELLVTPIQLALMTCEVVTGGQPLRPHVLREVRGLREYRMPRAARSRFEARPEDWNTVRRALELVVEAGTGTASQVRGLRIGGKTGTAQNPHGEDHALYVCYAPADQPEIAVAIVIENGGHGGSAAAPRAGQVLSTLFLPDSLRPPPRYGNGSVVPVAASPGAADAD